jgi:calcium-dependent protein kinase
MIGDKGDVKFIDFGFALVQNKRRAEMDIAGTPYYIAPEVLSGVYGKECDIWSIGVCLYQMITGDMPFDGNSQQDVFGKIKSGKFSIPSRVSEDAKDLIKKMIKVSPRERITAADIMNHPWMKKYENNDCCDDNEPHEHKEEAKLAI